MRVAIVTLRFDAPGGVETNVRAVSAWLRRAGEEVTVYASDLYDEGQWDRRSEWPATVDGVPVKRFPVAKKLVPGLTMPLMTGLVRALADDAPDVIHAHSHRYGHVLESAAVAYRTGIPLAVTTHYHPADPSEPWHKAMLLRAQDHLFGASAYRVASAIVVETERERAQLAEFAPTRGIAKIPPGIHVADWEHPGSDRAPPGLPDRYLLFAGRIARNKGLSGLLNAYALVPEPERPDLVLVGADWGLRPGLEEQARRLGIERSVHWWGHVRDDGEYRAIFRRASAFVLPSEYEAFGMVLLEAMAAGIPIVANRVGGIPEVLEEGRVGRLVPFGDPGAMAAAIRATFREEAVSKALVREGFRRVREFDWARIAEAHQALFRRLAA